VKAESEGVAEEVEVERTGVEKTIEFMEPLSIGGCVVEVERLRELRG
jgi:hypothetical protein